MTRAFGALRTRATEGVKRRRSSRAWARGFAMGFARRHFPVTRPPTESADEGCACRDLTRWSVAAAASAFSTWRTAWRRATMARRAAGFAVARARVRVLAPAFRRWREYFRRSRSVDARLDDVLERRRRRVLDASLTAWSDAASRERRRRRLGAQRASTFLRRDERRALRYHADEWLVVATRAANARRVAARRGARAGRRHFASTFARWSEWTRHSGSVRRDVARSFARTVASSASLAFRGWRGGRRVSASSRRKIAARVVARLVGRTVAEAFAAWRCFVDDFASTPNRRATRVVAHLRSRSLARGFDAWLSTAASLRRDRATTGRVVAGCAARASARRGAVDTRDPTRETTSPRRVPRRATRDRSPRDGGVRRVGGDDGGGARRERWALGRRRGAWRRRSRDDATWPRAPPNRDANEASFVAAVARWTARLLGASFATWTGWCVVAATGRVSRGGRAEWRAKYLVDGYHAWRKNARRATRENARRDVPLAHRAKTRTRGDSRVARDLHGATRRAANVGEGGDEMASDEVAAAWTSHGCRDARRASSRRARRARDSSMDESRGVQGAPAVDARGGRVSRSTRGVTSRRRRAVRASRRRPLWTVARRDGSRAARRKRLAKILARMADRRVAEALDGWRDATVRGEPSRDDATRRGALARTPAALHDLGSTERSPRGSRELALRAAHRAFFRHSRAVRNGSNARNAPRFDASRASSRDSSDEPSRKPSPRGDASSTNRVDSESSRDASARKSPRGKPRAPSRVGAEASIARERSRRWRDGCCIARLARR